MLWDVLVDLVRFELTTSSMPWSRDQSLAAHSNANKRLARHGFGRHLDSGDLSHALDSTRTLHFDVDSTAESRPGVVLHMPRARSHGVLRFFVARRISSAYTYGGFHRILAQAAREYAHAARSARMTACGSRWITAR